MIEDKLLPPALYICGCPFTTLSALVLRFLRDKANSSARLPVERVRCLLLSSLSFAVFLTFWEALFTVGSSSPEPAAGHQVSISLST